MKTELIATRECELCREALFIIRESFEASSMTCHETDERVVALNVKDKKHHVCFTLPQDANLLVMEDYE
jgi:hypothetical protein